MTRSHKTWECIHGAVLMALIVGNALVPNFRIWPLCWILPLGVYAVLMISIQPLRTTFRPWAFGRASMFDWFAACAIAIISCAALAAFHRWTQPDDQSLRKMIPVDAMGGAKAAILVFSMGNALLEEIIFRGVLYDALEAAQGKVVAVLGSALIFGWCHLHGYPPGLWGALLATVYGIALGWLRMVTGGLGLTVLAHITADATIFALVFRLR